ncbi:hypothetical protein EV14_2791 [Prochlorococcus sp. MIT 0703]|nr:hypothetical protein EV12_2694 [Prochlorococcus sp. MIT 0701]KGG30852.1 hypothetical protein EV14_2791 [Prochlorococcus sp. MIT 0703]
MQELSFRPLTKSKTSSRSSEQDFERSSRGWTDQAAWMTSRAIS